MPILSFMSDEHLHKCIENLYNAYMNNKKDFTLEELYKNKLDPIKTFFDMQFNHLTLSEFIDNEAQRKKDKSVNNHIGIFHQELLDGLNGFEAPKNSGYDVRKLDNTIFGELKNKHNTMNSSSSEATFKKLEKLADDNTKAICYLIEVVAKESQCIPWKPTCSGKTYEHDRVKRISIDKFYELATGQANAFKELCCAIINETPKIVLKKAGVGSTTTNEAFKELTTRAKELGITEIDTIFKDNFNGYNGF